MTEESPETKSMWHELQRRKVVRVAVAYIVVGWVLIQIADTTIEPLHLPSWSGTLVIWLVGLGFPVAVILAWVLDVTPRGISVTKADDRAAPDDATIAVLPFVNMSGNEENEYFSDGMSEELLNLLARLRHLRVCSRTSAFALKGTMLSMPLIASQLGVRYVLEGSVRRSGDKVRITAQLVDAREDCHLWSETYDRELQDIFSVQDEIAGHIFSSLKMTLTSAEQKAIRSTTDNVDAFDCYLRGREQYHLTTPGHLELARELFEEAIRIDPDYALAWAGLTYVFVDTYWYRDKRIIWIEKAEDASTKAVESAPHLAESHAARGLALRVQENFPEAEAALKNAIAINPKLFEPIHFYAQMLRSLERFEEAADMFEKAAEARPEDYQAMALASNMYEGLEIEEKEIETAQKTIERAERALEIMPTDARAMVLGAMAYNRVGDTEHAIELVQKAYELDPDSASTAYNSACLYAAIGEDDRALDFIEVAIGLGSRNKRYFETDPDFNRLQDHPRFVELMNRI